jgi:tRNA A37 threonylcarbamoyladenosine synthetase subunit TsaC/SUA5/YrdC
MILDGGNTPGSHSSTIIACEENKLICLREGQIPFSEVTAIPAEAKL